LFGPDHNLAEYVQEKTGKTIIPIPERGFCPTHLLFHPEDVQAIKARFPDAVAMVHPECTAEMRRIADFIGSTSQMCKYARDSAAKTFIVATEEGLIHRLKKENPNKEFYPPPSALCPNMKKITIEKVVQSLEQKIYPVKIDAGLRERAYEPIKKMLELGR
ncbi:MAG: quinolinate synthase NadA, partial [Thermoplasmata archaeon]